MSLRAIADAFNQALVGFTAGGDIQWEGTTYRPDINQPYLAVSMATYSRSPSGIGPTTPMMESGTFSVRVMRPSGEGLSPGAAVADAVAALFARGRSLATDTGQQISLMSASAAPAYTAGEWLAIPVAISWFTNDL